MIFKDCTCGECGETFDAEPEGGHRLMCGDATNKADVEAVLCGRHPLLMVTDPPYGINYDPEWRHDVAGQIGHKVGNESYGKVHNDDRFDWGAAWDLFAGDVAYVWHAGVFAAEVAVSLKVSKFAIRAQIIWTKQTMVIGRGDYHWKHEPCWYAVRLGRRGGYVGGRKQNTVWEIAARQGYFKGKPEDGKTGHSTQKPVECMRRPIENNSRRGADVYDPFLGSGTSVIAAQMAGRWCLGLELDPGHADIGVLRWQDYAKMPAVLEPTGDTFDKVASSRRRSKK